MDRCISRSASRGVVRAISRGIMAAPVGLWLTACDTASLDEGEPAHGSRTVSLSGDERAAQLARAEASGEYTAAQAALAAIGCDVSKVATVDRDAESGSVGVTRAGRCDDGRVAELVHMQSAATEHVVATLAALDRATGVVEVRHYKNEGGSMLEARERRRIADLAPVADTQEVGERSGIARSAQAACAFSWSSFFGTSGGADCEKGLTSFHLGWGAASGDGLNLDYSPVQGVSYHYAANGHTFARDKGDTKYTYAQGGTRMSYDQGQFSYQNAARTSLNAGGGGFNWSVPSWNGFHFGWGSNN